MRNDLVAVGYSIRIMEAEKTAILTNSDWKSLNIDTTTRSTIQSSCIRLQG